MPVPQKKNLIETSVFCEVMDTEASAIYQSVKSAFPILHVHYIQSNCMNGGILARKVRSPVTLSNWRVGDQG